MNETTFNCLDCSHFSSQSHKEVEQAEYEQAKSELLIAIGQCGLWDVLRGRKTELQKQLRSVDFNLDLGRIQLAGTPVTECPGPVVYELVAKPDEVEDARKNILICGLAPGVVTRVEVIEDTSI